MKSVYSRVATIAALIGVAVLVASCGDFKKSNAVNAPSNGSVDFSTYVSIGNSLTAGYQSGALYESAQKYSYPADIARQAGVPGAAFQQPLISDPGIGGRMKILNLNGPVIGEAPEDAGTPLNIALNRPYNNLGIPGAVLGDLLNTTDFAAQANPAGRNNPFFQIVLRSSQFGRDVVEQALALHPTFVSVWIGANDVLGYATKGGVGQDPTSSSLFNAMFNQTMDSLLAGAPNAKFVVANIPNVTAIPFFTTVPDSFANPVTGQNIGPFIVQRHHADGTLYVGPVHANTDYILLTAIDSLENKVGVPSAVGGTGRPLPDQFVLDSLEVAKTEAAITAYNATIAAFAAAHPDRVALVNSYDILNNLDKYGYIGQGVVLTSKYIEGGFFGLDGIHPTSQGYAYIANQFIAAINARFASTIAPVSISSVPSSIVLGKVSLHRGGLPDVHYSALEPTLKLLQGAGDGN